MEKLNPKTKDLSGQKFGMLTVIRFYDYIEVGKNKARTGRVLCKCDCGKEKVVKTNCLNSGNVTSCGCKLLKCKDLSEIEDITGFRSGKLEVMSFYKREKTTSRKRNLNTSYWLCKCDCGKEKVVLEQSIKTKVTRSCGCLIGEVLSLIKPSSLPKGEAAWNRYFGSYVKSANLRKIEFSITKSEFIDICKKDCVYCGVLASKKYPPVSGQRSINGTIMVNGVDRRDNKIGYTVDNCVPCCSMCNIAKRDVDINIWNEWLDRIVEFRIKGKIDA